MRMSEPAVQWACPSCEEEVQTKPLPASERAFFEPRFGCDFSQVRVHTDSRAAESARAVNALTFTIGRDVMFESGRYSLERGGGDY